MIGKLDMTLETMTTLVAASEAMDLINASLRSKHSNVPRGKGLKGKEEAMQAAEKPVKKKEA